jgi:dTDP-4-amino-4,6-dideoxygalactose transaminase
MALQARWRGGSTPFWTAATLHAEGVGMPVSMLDLRRQYAPLEEEFLSAIREVCAAQALVLGPRTERFERAVEEMFGARNAIGVSSGTDAELLLLMALGIGPGDAVITSPFTFFATAGCIARVGARPVFADIEPATCNLDVERLSDSLEKTPNVKAIVPVHLYGQCADMTAILDLAQRFGVPVLEDAAQAMGAHHPLGAAGTMGEAGWFSFYPTKNLGAFGDAGMLVCRDDALAAKCRALRNHGMEPRYFHSMIGGNFRIDAIQSAVLSVKLPHLSSWNAARRERAAFYRAEIERRGLPVALPAERWESGSAGPGHIYHQFVIRVQDRDRVKAAMAVEGVGTEVYYPLPLHLQECFQYLGHREGDFPEAERAARETLALPMFAELTSEEQLEVVAALERALGAGN